MEITHSEMYKHLFAIPAAVTSDLKRLIDTWQAYHKTSSMKQLVNGESDYV